MKTSFQNTLARVSSEKFLTCRVNTGRLRVCPKRRSEKRKLEWPFCFKLQIDACDSPDGRTQSTENFRRIFSLAVLRSLNLRNNLTVIKSDRPWGKVKPKRWTIHKNDLELRLSMLPRSSAEGYVQFMCVSPSLNIFEWRQQLCRDESGFCFRSMTTKEPFPCFGRRGQQNPTKLINANFCPAIGSWIQ